ncbi:hypothetical protein ABBQ32_003688 [Trebouxia sp. C0010 RCD-2024]
MALHSQSASQAPRQLGYLCSRSWSRACGGHSAVYTAAAEPQVGSLSPLFPVGTARIQSCRPDQTWRQRQVQDTAALTHAAELQPSASTPCQLQGFNDPQLAFSAKSTGQLMQSLAIFRACSVKPLVQNADVLLAAAKKVVGPAVVTSVVRHTFFKQFCGGECERSLSPTANMLRKHGIRPILNYAAEDDISDSPAPILSADTAAEQLCDRNMLPFLKSIEDSASREGKGFVAAKVTCLGDCDMMKEVSAHFSSISRITGHHVAELPSYLATVLSPCRLQLALSMLRRMETVAEAAAAKGNVRLLIDAEHSYMQPAIDAVVIHLQQKFNKQTPVVFNTYQCYLKDSHQRVVADMRLAKERGFLVAAKVVRGAYIHLERERAADMGYPSPIHDTLEDTHHNYNRCVKEMMSQVKAHGFEMMVASHNQASVETAVALMHEMGMHPTESGVHFGQLLGMADHLTYTLGASGYQAYKSVPYGPVEETIAYLLRRAKENSDMLGGVGKETSMLKSELWRRIKCNNPVAQLFRKQPVEAMLAGA